MDVNADDACPKICTKNGLRTCSACETPGQFYSEFLQRGQEYLQQKLIFSSLSSPESQNSKTSALDDSLSLPASDCSTVEDNKHLLCNPTVSTYAINNRLQITPKTKKIETLFSLVSKLKKLLYEKNTFSRVLGQLQAEFADKPYLFIFIRSQLHMQGRSNKGWRWSTTEK
ncbi:hypothetical protein HNY73_000160 [Argiope bruennichi]|uniref:Uncharacterized protein n=1 Tax=Argiope bruennichi TaxID=94029 RepID=A0A8T0FY52_ARGBR|nr:hypothetical protein HNY73_000160 [Argiope bruennichi]